jgi:hypothetical protein
MKITPVAVALAVGYKTFLKRWVGQSSLAGPVHGLPSPTVKRLDVLTADAKELQSRLENGDVTSLDLVKRYIQQIQRYDDKLHAMIQTTPNDLLEATANALDRERASGKIRGPLHGMPIIVKVGLLLYLPPKICGSCL